MPIKKELISLFDSIAELLEFTGGNKFKISAFKNASNTIRRIEGDVDAMIADGSINNVPGIGKSIQSVIYEFMETGLSTEYENLSNVVPKGIIEVFNIRGLGAKKIRSLYEELGVDSIESLEQACIDNRVANLKGFGGKTQAKITEEIMNNKKRKGFLLLNKAFMKGDLLLNEISQMSSVKGIEFTGELRRRLEVISSIELMAKVTGYAEFENDLANSFKYNKLQESIHFNSSELKNDIDDRIIIHYTTESNYDRALFITTGSNKFFAGAGIDEYNISCNSEESILSEFNLPFIIPEMREHEYFTANKEINLSSNLQLKDFNGFIHFHTTKSDGQNTLKEMVKSAIDIGFEYMVVCDHSKSAFYANGLSEERVLLQKQEVKEVGSQLGVKIFQGIESDILKDGSLDYDNDFLKNFQFVVASIHSIFNLSEDEMTARIIKAIENPFTDLLAHPTGRLLLARDPYNVNIKKVIDACVTNDVAIEINASPHRLDLDWRNIYYAREKGCKFAINPDAHSTDGIKQTQYGIMMARKGGMQKVDVINCYNIKDFEKYINRKILRTN